VDGRWIVDVPLGTAVRAPALTLITSRTGPTADRCTASTRRSPHCIHAPIAALHPRAGARGNFALRLPAPRQVLVRSVEANAYSRQLSIYRTVIEPASGAQPFEQLVATGVQLGDEVRRARAAGSRAELARLVTDARVTPHRSIHCEVAKADT
jgi:hypothetical protein